jgi:LPXTG-motif cell wall-anchored protein
MWTGDGREETVYLGTFQGLTTNTKIAQYMDQNSNTIDNWVAQVCSGYRWTDGKIYENKWSDDEIEWNDRMGYSNQEAYINVFRDSKDVVIFVHTSRTYVDHDWIKVEGKTTNDTLTLDEAKAIVRKYYKFSSLKMYSNDDWNAYVDGNNNIEPQNAVAIGSGNVTKIHVLITGSSANSSSGSSSGSGSTADSSNPKTGDEIFAPVMILGLSASALAVLFYLNKKRAF